MFVFCTQGIITAVGTWLTTLAELESGSARLTDDRFNAVLTSKHDYKRKLTFTSTIRLPQSGERLKQIGNQEDKFAVANIMCSVDNNKQLFAI